MTLLILEDSARMGGVQHSTFNLMLGMQRHHPDIRFCVVFPEEGVFPERCRALNWNTQVIERAGNLKTSISLFSDRLRLPNIFALYYNRRNVKRYGKQLAKFVEKFKPDIIITKGMGAHFAGGMAAKRRNIPCVWHLQDQISERYGGLYRYIFGKYAEKYSTRTISDGISIIKQLPPKLQSKSVYVPNGVETTEFYRPELREEIRAELGIPEDAYVIGHIARLIAWKGQHLLIDAFAEYAARNPTAYLLLVGSPLFNNDNYPALLQRKIQTIGLEYRVIMPGYRDDLGAVLTAMDAFIYPSVEKDTTPLSVVAALSCGLPTAVSDIEGLREMYDETEGRFFFPNRSVDDMVTAMMFFADLALRTRAGKDNRKFAVEHYSIEAYTNIVVEHLQRAIDEQA
jgi:glycosyltransferase involved in cell wall biosynthesis